MLVEEVVEAQPELRLIEVAAAADSVVEECVGDAERIDGGLIVINTVVLVGGSNALVEESEVPAFALIGNAFSLGVRGRLRDPQT